MRNTHAGRIFRQGGHCFRYRRVVLPRSLGSQVHQFGRVIRVASLPASRASWSVSVLVDRLSAVSVGEFPGASIQSWVPFLLGTTLPTRPFVPGDGIIALLEYAGYTASSIRVALSRLCADGTLECRREGRKSKYRLAPQMIETIVSVDRRVEQFGREVSWNGRWTIVLASIPDSLRSTRRNMKSRLGYLGFGRMRETAWIAARDCESEVEDLIENLGLDGMVDVFVGEPAGLSDIDELLHRCWDLDALTAGYNDFVVRFAPLVPTNARDDLTAEESVLRWMRLTHDYRELVHRDPELPPEVLPDAARSLRHRVVETYATIHDDLFERAQAHARRMFELDSAP
ncbi:PaaX family transcriptional regulator [Rhodococcus rhodochrous]|uniref:PaaX family transcriptional regulator n=1 Tax=Rhodococcus rhodochrous TaxID=1829 RepID=UPI001C4EE16F|nr:PaaX family transcriptional regulator C-terminal domain-containing protein [Rhodococcus rhodochrous]MCD2100436.1 hypothetical protein [Rhodococcus rhodochrous]MCD2124771.1 hypothetical protein [Rhodococcus rhodochrous]MCQ4138125.1 hypothetical protein [Rhodococcus rhodochrous]MDJ0021607.1 PaaX family transcriptional regulator C-terminal domain-containing protein [Rhodococcus rhodochrous]